MLDLDALAYWIKTYEDAPSIDKANRALETARLRNFNSSHIDYSIKRGYATEADRPKMQADYKKELEQDIVNAHKWYDPSNWELVLKLKVEDHATLNNPPDDSGWGDCMPDHAEEEKLCHMDRSLGKYGEHVLDRPFTVRIFYRTDSDYEIAFVFTDVDDNEIIAISQRED